MARVKTLRKKRTMGKLLRSIAVALRCMRMFLLMNSSRNFYAEFAT
jgi:hypothetical protein